MNFGQFDQLKRRTPRNIILINRNLDRLANAASIIRREGVTSACAAAKEKEEMSRRLEDRRIPIGKYGSGTLWFERSQRGEFILFDAVKIAELRRPGTPSEGTWISLEPGWKVTAPSGTAEIWVQHKGSEGVVIPVRWGRR
jgi:hypothetical protein